MAAQEEDIGPYRNLRYDSRIADYLENSPPAADMDCINGLLDGLERGKVTVKTDHLGQTRLVYACNHIIEIYKERYVVSIKPNYAPTTQ
jgi:hypothetical protein